jgi:hypothetical protein
MEQQTALPNKKKKIFSSPYTPAEVGDRTVPGSDIRNSKLVALAGAAAVVIGVFSPLISIPFFGAISYASQKQGEGFVMIGGAVVAALLCYLLNFFWPAVATGILVLIDVTITLINLHNISATMGDSSNPLVKAFANTVSPSWGFALLLIGGILLIASACLKEKSLGPTRNKTGNHVADHLFSWFAGPKPIDNNQIGAPDVKQEQLKSDERFDFATQTWQPTSAKKAKEG